VEREIEVSRHPKQAVLDAFTQALRLIGSPEQESGSAPGGSVPELIIVKLTSPELIARLRVARNEIQSGLPLGVEVDEEDAARVLLHEALTAREAKARGQ